MANTYTYPYPSADLHSVPDVYPVAYTNSYALPDTESRSYIHTIPDLYTLAYVDTYTCANSYGGAYADTDSDCANTDTGANSYCRTDTDSDRDPAYGDAGANGYCRTDTDSDRDAAYGDPANPYAITNGYAYAPSKHHDYPRWTSNQRCSDEYRNWDICNYGSRRTGPCKLPGLNEYRFKSCPLF